MIKKKFIFFLKKNDYYLRWLIEYKNSLWSTLNLKYFFDYIKPIYYIVYIYKLDVKKFSFLEANISDIESFKEYNILVLHLFWIIQLKENNIINDSEIKGHLYTYFSSNYRKILLRIIENNEILTKFYTKYYNE